MDKIETARKIEQVIKLIGEIPREHLQGILEYCEHKESTYGLLHFDDFEVISKRKNRAKAFLEFKDLLERTDELNNSNIGTQGVLQ